MAALLFMFSRNASVTRPAYTGIGESNIMGGIALPDHIPGRRVRVRKGESMNNAQKTQRGIKIRSHLHSGLWLPQNLKYTQDDYWFDPATGKFGLTDFAQTQIADIAYLEYLVTPGTFVHAGTPIFALESTKVNREFNAPVDGKVVAINTDTLVGFPHLINSDPYGDGWMIQFQGVDSSKLMNAGDYQKWIDSYAMD